MKTDFRDLVSTAVHQAVTEFTGDDGCGHCDLYSLAGMFLLREITGLSYQLQLGSLCYLIDPPGNGWFQIDAREGGLKRLEYHAWIGLAGTTVGNCVDGGPKKCKVGELVDFSARHLKAMSERMQGITRAERFGEGLLLTLDPTIERIAWTRTDGPPDYLWTNGEPPTEFRYYPDEECINMFYEYIGNHRDTLASIRRLAFEKYHQLRRFGKSS